MLRRQFAKWELKFRNGDGGYRTTVPQGAAEVAYFGVFSWIMDVVAESA